MINVPIKIWFDPHSPEQQSIDCVLWRNCFNAEKCKLSRQAPNNRVIEMKQKKLKNCAPKIMLFTAFAMKRSVNNFLLDVTMCD